MPRTSAQTTKPKVSKSTAKVVKPKAVKPKAAPKVSRKKTVEEPIVEVPIVEPVVSTSSSMPDSSGKKTKREQQIETVFRNLEELDSILVELSNETKSLKLPKLTKSLKRAERLTNKVFTSIDRVTRKKKPRSDNSSSDNGGFNKPVAISREMADFMGCKPDELVSRTDVTRSICKYIKENGLQNPNAPIEILPQKSKKLSNLLSYDSKTAEKPLTWIGIQSYIKHHFPKA